MLASHRRFALNAVVVVTALGMALAACSSAPKSRSATEVEGDAPCPNPLPTPAAEPLKWRSWRGVTFEGRPVVLHVGTQWCHWCHVMEDRTYKDPRIVRMLNTCFVPVRADADGEPDLANRYAAYGWPATIIFDGQGREIVKRRGYIAPDEMLQLLHIVAKDPTPGPSVLNQRQDIPSADEARFFDRYDTVRGGWGLGHKFIEPDAVEYAVRLALKGNTKAAQMARQTLDAARQLIDPAWGGIYQYSDSGVWTNPHFEKIMQAQAEALRSYALGYMLFKDSGHKRAAEAIVRYLREFLRDPASGAFYTSQDADLRKGEHAADYFALDDAERRKRGIPPVDRRVFSRENGWAVRALALWYGASGDDTVRRDAVTAAEWIVAHRTQNGVLLFAHGDADTAGPFLGDTLEMGRAFLALYAVTAERIWLNRAVEAATQIERTFKLAAGGYATSASGPLKVPHADENLYLAQFAALVAHYSGHERFTHMARQAWDGALSPSAIEGAGHAATALLAKMAVEQEPIHLTVVGATTDDAAHRLFAEARRLPWLHLRLEWYNRVDPLMNMDVEFPPPGPAAVFLCANGACSLPIEEPDDLRKAVEEMLR